MSSATSGRRQLRYLLILVGVCFLTSPINVFAFSEKCIALLDAPIGHDHQKKIFQILKTNIKKCPTCKIKNFPIYDKQGDLKKSTFLLQIQTAAKSCRLLHLSWNTEYTADYDDVVKELQKVIAEGQLIVGAAGAPSEGKIATPIEKSVLGHVKDIILISELDQKNKQVINSFFGKQILTALHPPNKLEGSSFSSALFSAELLLHVENKTNKQWLRHFQDAKAKSYNQWPSLDEFFK